MIWREGTLRRFLQMCSWMARVTTPPSTKGSAHCNVGLQVVQLKVCCEQTGWMDWWIVGKDVVMHCALMGNEGVDYWAWSVGVVGWKENCTTLTSQACCLFYPQAWNRVMGGCGFAKWNALSRREEMPLGQGSDLCEKRESKTNKRFVTGTWPHLASYALTAPLVVLSLSSGFLAPPLSFPHWQCLTHDLGFQFSTTLTTVVVHMSSSSDSLQSSRKLHLSFCIFSHLIVSFCTLLQI